MQRPPHEAASWLRQQDGAQHALLGEWLHGCLSAATLEEALAHIMRHRGVWAATGNQILDAWRAAQPQA